MEIINWKDENIILFRTICCSISMFCCFLLMVVYFILCFQVKFNVCTKNEGDDAKSLLDNEMSLEDEQKNENKNKKGKIGLGSNFMFLLTVSNFFGSFFEFLFYFYYINFKKEGNYNNSNLCQLYNDINSNKNCSLFALAHNFFDLFTICWISMLTLLFYRSTNLSNEMLYHDTKYLIIGFIFSISSCLIFCAIPYATGSYGFARFYCSFRYYDEIYQDCTFKKEDDIDKIWRYSFVGVSTINSLFNIYCLFKTYKFYSKKLKIIKNQNKNEYKLMIIYVWVFRIFPIVLIISRLFKGLSRIIIDNVNNGTFSTVIQYFNGFLFASNGIFDSLACIFFFRGVFWCCNSSNAERSISGDKEYSDLNDLGNDIRED